MADRRFDNDRRVVHLTRKPFTARASRSGERNAEPTSERLGEQALIPSHGRNLTLEIERLRTQVDRLRSRKNLIDHVTLQTYEDMLETRLAILEHNLN